MSLKIALVTPMKEHYGGVETVNTTLEKALSEHQLVYVTLDGNSNLSFKDKIKRKIIGNVALIDPSGIDESFDVVICNGEFGWNINHPRCINLFHGSYYGYKKGISPFIGTKQKLHLMRDSWIQTRSAQGKYVVCVSNFVKKNLEKQNIKVDEVIVNGVDCNLFSPIKNVTPNGRCLFVGAADYYGKGIDILEKVAAMGLEIDCVSSKPAGKSLGWIPCRSREELVDLYRSYSLLIFPSRFEGCSMVALEAMACGMPIVISPVGIADELQHIIPEFVVPDFNPVKFYNKAKIIMDNRANYSNKAVKFVQDQYNNEIFNKKWKALIQKIART